MEGLMKVRKGTSAEPFVHGADRTKKPPSISGTSLKHLEGHFKAMLLKLMQYKIGKSFITIANLDAGSPFNLRHQANHSDSVASLKDLDKTPIKRL